VSIIFGGLLIAVGLGGYFGTGTSSVTALIPAFVGGLLAVLGVVALKESLLKHAMHAAALLGLIGFLAAAGRFVPKALQGADLREPALLCTGAMALLCAAFVGCCVNSFIQARRRRAARAAADAPR
jgi:hypothetical protein